MYSLSARTILRSEPQYYNTYAAFDYAATRTELLTENQYRILERISSEPHDVGEISCEMGVRDEECERFLNRMLKLGYVDADSSHIEIRSPELVKVDSSVYEGFPVPFLSAPASVDLFITNRCNLNCVHCFSSTEDQAVHDLAAKDVKSVLDQLERLRVLELRINGGEPFMHPEIDDLLTSLKHRRLRKVIVTNGTLLDERKVRLMKESHVTPTVSIDDSDAVGHDLFRRVEGSFDRTMKGLELLKKHRVEFGINCCLHRRNLSNHRKIIDLAITYGASRIAFLDLKPSPRMRSNASWVPSYSEYMKALPKLVRDRVKYARKIDVALDTFLTCQPLKESIAEARRGYICCQAGRSRLSIDSTGSVYPCNLVISDARWNMGKLVDESISKIWLSKRWSFFRGDVRVDNLKTCCDCKNLTSCRDFYCRLSPYVEYGDPYGSHPKCNQVEIRSVKG
jgi:radical SAM protein with 4Fe4S-binding SPASM domain